MFSITRKIYNLLIVIVVGGVDNGDKWSKTAWGLTVACG
nr:MAG TPA: hypothetical protein [Caudoviricetes sp.]